MIQWLAPWAFAGAVLLAGPLLVHMLRRRNARRVVFPAAHFLQPTRAAAVRFRRPSDVGLMILRLAIVAAAVAAGAQPLVMTRWRTAGWDGRTVRAVIVDTSRGLPSLDDAMRLAQQEMQASAVQAQRFSGEDMPDALARAAAWFAQAPPGRREVVVVSDFQRGSLDAQDFAVLPASVGIRLIRAGRPPATREVPLLAVSGRGAPWQPSMRVAPDGTAVTWRRAGAFATTPWLTTAQAPEDTRAAERAVRAAASFGVPAGEETRQVRVKFAGAPNDAASRRPVRERWMVDAALALRHSPLLGEAAAPVTASEQQGRLLVETPVTAASAAASAVLRAVMLAVRPASIADREAEVATSSDAELAAWRRDPAPVDAGPRIAPPGIASDGRWLWLAVLPLLGIEAWARRARQRSRPLEVRDAA